jgi:hypothetical protein
VGEEKGAKGGRSHRGACEYWRARGHACARAGEPKDGDHRAARALAASPWLGLLSGVCRVMMSTLLTRSRRERRTRGQVGVVVIMVAGMVWHWIVCANFWVSECMACLSEVIPSYLTRWAM